MPVGIPKQGETPVYRHPDSSEELYKLPEDITSLKCIWENRVKNSPDKKMLEDMTCKEADTVARKVGSWLQARGHKLFYLFAKNSVEWSLADLACWLYGMVNVPLYTTLGPEAITHILELT